MVEVESTDTDGDGCVGVDVVLDGVFVVVVGVVVVVVVALVVIVVVVMVVVVVVVVVLVVLVEPMVVVKVVVEQLGSTTGSPLHTNEYTLTLGSLAGLRQPPENRVQGPDIWLLFR